MNRLISGPTPFYHQIGEIIREKIENRELQTGDRIPSEEELCKEFEVSRTTVRQALQSLELDNLIERKPGRGSFVKDKPRKMASLKMTCLLDDLIALGIPATSKLIDRRVIVPPTFVAETMNLAEDDFVLCFSKIVSVEETTFAARKTFLPLWMDKFLSDDDLRSEHLLKTISNKCDAHPSDADQLVEAVMADTTVASMLDVNIGSPILSVTRCSYDSRHECIEYSISSYRSDRTRFYISQKNRRSAKNNWVLSSLGGRATRRERSEQKIQGVTAKGKTKS